MFAVIFEVQPKSVLWGQYLDLAKQLRPELERIEGFIENERYKRQRIEGRLLSLSLWADEKAVIRWRTHAMHHGVQELCSRNVAAGSPKQLAIGIDASHSQGQHGKRFSKHTRAGPDVKYALDSQAFHAQGDDTLHLKEGNPFS